MKREYRRFLLSPFPDRPLLRMCLTTILIIMVHAYSKAQGVEPILKILMDNVRSNGNHAINSNPLYDPANAGNTLRELEVYFKDSLYTVRAKAYTIASVVGKKTSDPTLRKLSVNQLLIGCNDQESSIIGICSKALQRFNLDDFDTQAKQQIKGLLINPTSYLNNIALVAGYIGEKEYEPALVALYSKPNASKRDKFAIQLALARMGNLEMLDELLSRIRGLQVNDDVIYEAGPALAYVHQKQGIDYLFEIILSNAKNCESANPDSNTKILCGYRALEFVAPVVKDFPLKVDVDGDLDVNNYEEALKTARAWIVLNKSNYEIFRDKF
jgi:hypothetical protein